MSAEHRSERLRAHPLSTPDETGEHYLNTLPDDILRIVLRHLSDRPQHQTWHAYISAFSVNTALEVGGALTHVATLEFQNIGGKDGIPVRAFVDASILRSLFYRLPLRRLVFELRTEEVLPGLLHGCGAELRELVLNPVRTVITNNHILAISTHCTKLSLLAIHGNRVQGTLAPIWRSIGFSLIQIYVGCYYPAFGYETADIVSQSELVDHCVNLRRVDVERLTYAIADILITLGSRIRDLRIGDPSYTTNLRWRDVYGACTNLEAAHSALDSSSIQAVDVLSLIRTKLVSLKLYNLHAMHNLHEQDDMLQAEDGFFSVLSTCSVLRNVELPVWKSLPEEILRKLFESLKSVTTLSCIVRTSDVNFSKEMIDMMICYLTSLESFTISTQSLLKGEDVNALVDLPHLKSVTLRHWFSEESVAEKRAVEVVKRFKDCAQLMHLEIDDFNLKNRSSLIAETAVTYGRKEFDMFIGGVQYRTW